MKKARRSASAHRSSKTSGAHWVICMAALLTGCATELATVRVKSSDAMPQAGAPYNLTFTQYEIAITRRLSACSREVEGVTVKDMVVTFDASATRKEVRDPRREYVIDFLALRSFFKTTSITVEYHENGALKSVNATSDDKTAEFLSSIFASAGKVVGMSSPKAAMAEPPDPDAGCSRKIADRLASVPGLEGQVKAKTKELEFVKSELERLTEMGKAMGRAWGPKERTELAAQISAMYKLNRELAKVNESLKNALSDLSFSTTVKWPLDGETFGASTALFPPLTETDLKKWGRPTKANLAELTSSTGVWVNLVAMTDIGRKRPCVNNVCMDDEVAGLKYRMPAPGLLLLCSSAKCQSTKDPDVIASDDGLVSQLGPVLSLPLKNYPFMNQSIEATFNNAGQPTKLGYKSDAAAEKVASSFGALVDEVVKVKEARKPKTELEKLKEETELLKAQAELAAAKKALEPPKYATQAEAAAAFTADATVLQAELAKLQAEAALAAARAQAAKP